MAAVLLFRVSPSSGVPIYRQLIDQVLTLSASGRLKPGGLLPSVRQVAEELQVNPMTVSKAYSQLERDGVVEMLRGQGMRLRERTPAPLQTRLDEAMPTLRQAAAHARHLGLTREQTLERLHKAWEELDHG